MIGRPRLGRHRHWLGRLAIGLLLLSVTGAIALPPPMPVAVLRDLLVLPDGTLLVAHSHGIYRSAGAGQPWQRVAEDPAHALFDAGSDGLFALALPLPPTRVPDAEPTLLHSADGGRHWQRRGPPHAVQARLDDGRLLGCTENGLEVSGDGGRSWQRWPDAPPARGCGSLRIGAGRWLVQSTDAMEAWVAEEGAHPWRALTNFRHDDGEVLESALLDDLGRLHMGWVVYGTTLLPDGRMDGERHRIEISSDGGRTRLPLALGLPAPAFFKAIAAGGDRVFFEFSDGQPPWQRGIVMLGRGMRTVLPAHHGALGWRLVPGADGKVYVIDRYGLSQYVFEASSPGWQPLLRRGLPDPSTGEPQP